MRGPYCKGKDMDVTFTVYTVFSRTVEGRTNLATIYVVGISYLILLRSMFNFDRFVILGVSF